jgi:pimeloyl-ACP methyl ester carboxylesterase
VDDIEKGPTMTRTHTTQSTNSRRVVGRHTLAVAAAAVALAAAGCTANRSDDALEAPTTTAHTGPQPSVTRPTTSRPAAPEPTTQPTTQPTTVPTIVPTTAPVPEPARPTTQRDDLVAVGQTRMRIRCDGVGESTVLLVSGFESPSDNWSDVVSALTGRTRVCAYDRPGIGNSDPATTTQTFHTQTAELHELLRTAGEPGPYVVVGHSFGGMTAIDFAGRYADEVDALVLVDASPIDWPTTLCAVADDGTGAATLIHGMCAGWVDPTANAEHLDVFAAFAGMVDPPALHSLPVTVMTAVDRELPPDIADFERTRLTAAWDAGQSRWMQLSTASHLITVPDTGHLIQLDQPAAVIAAIDQHLI